MEVATLNENPLLARTRARRTNAANGRGLLGLFLLWPEPGIAELCGSLGLDFVVIDMEAGAYGRTAVVRMMQALAGSPTSVLVRVPCHDQHVIEHALDTGTHGVMVPKVNTAAEAAAVARATRFPPQGTRGVNPVRASRYFADLPTYFDTANETVVCLVQIETAAAVQVVGDIAATPGVDGVFVGVGDLAMSIGQPGRVTGDAIEAALWHVRHAAHSVGRLSGAFAYDLTLAREYAGAGHDVIAFGNDIKLLRTAILEQLDAITRADAPSEFGG